MTAFTVLRGVWRDLKGIDGFYLAEGLREWKNGEVGVCTRNRGPRREGI